jgi:lactate dehydrogenase-like 2-hydroxyacid dehydrogenase
MKAFIFDPLWTKFATPELLKQLTNADIEIFPTEQIAPLSACSALFQGNEPRILAINPDYVGWKIKSDDYKNIPNLKAILGAATSFSWIDRTHADAHNIPVCNIRNFSTEAVAEWAITMMWNLARQVPRLIKDGFPLDFDKDFMKYRGIELQGKTVGIIGLGNIGNAIAQRCAGLGMNVLYWSKSEKNVNYSYSDLQKLFARSDVIFPTLSDNPETRSLISTQLLESMKPTALLISVVHGLFDEALVLDMVKKQKLFGYGFEAKPASFSSYEGNVWAAPAYAWVTEGSMNNSMHKWIDNMVKAAQGSFPTRVN